MAIDIRSEEILTIPEAARWLGQRFRQAKRCPMTVRRWIHRGVLAADGSRVRLEALDDGTRLKTSVEALQRLFDRLAEIRAASDERGAQAGALGYRAMASAAHLAAMRELEEAGA